MPSARNSRRHSDEQVDQIVASIEEFGWTVPVLVAEDGQIIAGHGRVLAAKKLGLESVPVLVAAGWTEEQQRAYLIADNKLTLNGEWDEDLLRIELGELREAGFDLALTGFTADELESMVAGLDDTDEAAPADSIEDPPASQYKQQFGVIVVCADEAEQKAVYDRLSAEGLNVKVVAT